MSRGLGRIGQAIVTNITYVSKASKAPLPVQVSTWDLLCDVYNPGCIGDFEFTAAQRKAVVRAMHGFVRRYQQYALMGGQGRTMLYLYDPNDPLSTMWTKLRVANRTGKHITVSDARAALAAASMTTPS